MGGVGGLYLQVTPTGARSWILKYRTMGGKNREMGLGPYPEVPLSDARDAARTFKGQVRDRKDPVLERQKQTEAEGNLCSLASVWIVFSRFVLLACAVEATCKPGERIKLNREFETASKFFTTALLSFVSKNCNAAASVL